MGIRVIRPGDGERVAIGAIDARIIEYGSVLIGTMTPDLYVQYFRDLAQLPVDDQGMLKPADIASTMARYATDVVRASWSRA